MTSQNAINYIKTRVSATNFVNSGEITTICNVTLDDGAILSGNSVRDINGFDINEAQTAAYENAVSFLYPGADLILSKVG
jgi:hypothetical protein